VPPSNLAREGSTVLNRTAIYLEACAVGNVQGFLCGLIHRRTLKCSAGVAGDSNTRGLSSNEIAIGGEGRPVYGSDTLVTAANTELIDRGSKSPIQSQDGCRRGGRFETVSWRVALQSHVASRDDD